MGFKEEFVWYLTIFDMFPLTQYLRYNKSPKYQTVSGSIVSMIILAIFFYLFSGNALRLVRKESITWFA